MSRLYRPFGVALLIALVTACGSVRAAGRGPADPPKPNAHAAALQDYQARVTRYLALRKEATKKSPPPKPSEDIAKIKAAQQTLAATLQSMRKEAKPGDIFTPEIQTVFRRLVNPELKGKEGQAAKHEMKEDAPAAVPLKVNATYPDGAGLPTVPPNILLSLPVTPKELEYRIVGRDLLLRDVDANIIVDFIPNAIR